jgi:TRAP transporter TAXI family solute receptor
MKTNYKISKIIVSFAIVCSLIFVLVLSDKANAADVIRFSVGRVGGTYYVMGSGISEIIKKYVPGYNLEITTASGSIEDVRLVESGQVEMSQAPTSTLYDAKNQKGDFAKAKKPYTNINQVMNLHSNTWSPIVLKGSEIKKFTDIKGKQIAIPSSGHLQLFRDYLQAYRMKIEDVKWQYIPYTAAANALADKKVDMMFFHAGIPVAAADELAHRVKIRILPLDDYALKNLLKEKPFYTQATVPAGIYPGVDKDLPGAKIITSVICTKGLDPKFVYQVCKQFYGHLDYMATVHPSAKQIKVEDALKGQIFPLHPGAEKYYKEIGLLK